MKINGVIRENQVHDENNSRGVAPKASPRTAYEAHVDAYAIHPQFHSTRFKPSISTRFPYEQLYPLGTIGNV